MGFIDKMTVQCLGILWCAGTKSEKANILLDLMYAKDPQRESINIDDVEFRPVFNTIFRFSIIYSELFQRKVKTTDEEYSY